MSGVGRGTWRVEQARGAAMPQPKVLLPGWWQQHHHRSHPPGSLRPQLQQPPTTPHLPSWSSTRRERKDSAKPLPAPPEESPICCRACRHDSACSASPVSALHHASSVKTWCGEQANGPWVGGWVWERSGHAASHLACPLALQSSSTHKSRGGAGSPLHTCAPVACASADRRPSSPASSPSRSSPDSVS